MPTLEDDVLVFRFPKIEPDAQFSISFMRTLRIPDTEQTYFLPPGFDASHVLPDWLPKGRMPPLGGTTLPGWAGWRRRQPRSLC